MKPVRPPKIDRTPPLEIWPLPKEALNELSDQQLIIITVHDEFADAVGKKFMVEKDEELKSIIREI